MPCSRAIGESGNASFDTVYQTVRSFPAPLLLPSAPHDKVITNQISNLFVHPSLEVALHLLNHDLPSAHFLVRHMQAAPQYEGMYLHGILHRIEGDYDNARAWYADVAASDMFVSVWGEDGLERARDFIQRVQDLTEAGSQSDQDLRSILEQESVREIDGVVGFCKEKFGTGTWEDASGVWKQPTEGKVKEMKEDMVIGDKGFRRF